MEVAHSLNIIINISNILLQLFSNYFHIAINLTKIESVYIIQTVFIDVDMYNCSFRSSNYECCLPMITVCHLLHHLSR